VGAQAWNDSLIKRLQVVFTLACDNSRFSSRLAAWDVSPGETSAPLRQKFRIDDHEVNQCSHNESDSHGVANANLFDFVLLLVDFGKVLCSSANELQQLTQMLLLEKNIFHVYYSTIMSF